MAEEPEASTTKIAVAPFLIANNSEILLPDQNPAIVIGPFAMAQGLPRRGGAQGGDETDPPLARRARSGRDRSSTASRNLGRAGFALALRLASRDRTRFDLREQSGRN